MDRPRIEGLSSLVSPANDMEFLRKALANPNVGQFGDIRTIGNEGNVITVSRDISEAADRCKSGDFLLIYFSGYVTFSATESELHLLLGETEKTVVDTLPFRQVLQILQKSGASHKLAILDCSIYESGPSSILRTSEIEKIAIKESGEKNVNLIASFDVTGLSKTNHLTGFSYFTEALIDGLIMGDADINNDSIVDHEEMFEYLNEKLKTTNRSLHPIKSVSTEKVPLSFVSKSSLMSPMISKMEPSKSVGRILSRWDPDLVWDGVRNASGKVNVLQVWFPGVESEVTRYGEKKNHVNYKFLLINPKSPFVTIRIRQRKDFAFTFSDQEEKTTNILRKIDASAKWLWKKGYGEDLHFFDSYLPGPVYFIDNKVYYGLFLPHTDAALGPLHEVPLDSSIGDSLQRTFDFLWDKSNKSLPPKAPDLNVEAQLLERIEKLEHDISWLYYPVNRVDAPPLFTVENGQILDSWDITRILNRISSSKRRVYIALTWLIDPKEVLKYFGKVGNRDFRILLPKHESTFLKLRQTLIAKRLGNEEESIAYYQSLVSATAQEISRNPGIEVRYFDNSFFPGPIIIVDDSVFYGLYLRQVDIFKDPMHVLPFDSIPGQALAKSFEQVWEASSEDYD